MYFPQFDGSCFKRSSEYLLTTGFPFTSFTTEFPKRSSPKGIVPPFSVPTQIVQSDIFDGRWRALIFSPVAHSPTASPSEIRNIVEASRFDELDSDEPQKFPTTLCIAPIILVQLAPQVFELSGEMEEIPCVRLARS